MSDAPRPDLELICNKVRYTYYGEAQAEIFALVAYVLDLERQLADLKRQLTTAAERIAAQSELLSRKAGDK